MPTGINWFYLLLLLSFCYHQFVILINSKGNSLFVLGTPQVYTKIHTCFKKKKFFFFLSSFLLIDLNHHHHHHR